MDGHDWGSHRVKCDSYWFTGFWDMAGTGHTRTHARTHARPHPPPPLEHIVRYSQGGILVEEQGQKVWSFVRRGVFVNFTACLNYVLSQNGGESESWRVMDDHCRLRSRDQSMRVLLHRLLWSLNENFSVRVCQWRGKDLWGEFMHRWRSSEAIVVLYISKRKQTSVNWNVIGSVQFSARKKPIRTVTCWRGGSMGRASDSRSTWRWFESRQEHNKINGVFPSQKCCSDSLSVRPVCTRTHNNYHVRTLKIL